MTRQPPRRRRSAARPRPRFEPLSRLPAGTGWLGLDDIEYRPLRGTARRDTDDAGAVETGEAAAVADPAWHSFLASLQRDKVIDALEDEPAD